MNCTIALAGNPNCGKTTMFNKLTGSNQYVGNWPGVTVEKKEGRLRGSKNVSVVDLPGVYSLSPYTPEEVVSRDYLLHGDSGVVLDLVDGTSLERNLYLTTQLLEVGLPVVVALNMADLLHKSGIEVDADRLAGALGCEVVATSALRGEGLEEATRRAEALAANGAVPKGLCFSAPVEQALLTTARLVHGRVPTGRERWYAVKLFERDRAVLEELKLDEAERIALEAAVQPVEQAMGDDSESIVTGERYECIGRIMAACVKQKRVGLSTSDKIDRVVTNRWLALPIFVVIMFAVYFISIMSVGDFVTGWANDTLFGEWIGGGVGALLGGANAAPWLQSPVVDGIIGGVGAVLGFVPQMAILFLLLSFLEDCGYMARVAFIMDRIFRRFGLSGKSFIPLLIASGCGVPGIMATKTIENEKDRRMTVITTTFIPCGAKLPVIALIGGAILGGGWWVAPLIYFVGIAAVIATGIMLKKMRMFAGEPAPFVMEMPQYHMPALRSLLMHMWERVRSFIIRAGTIIFASSVIIWFLLSFGVENGSFAMVEDVQNSFLAWFGGLLAPLFAPLGFGNWQSSVGTIAGLVAKENLVSTMAVIQGLSPEMIEGVLDDTAPMWVFMQGLLPTMSAGLSFLVFNMLCAPCFAAIGAIRRQMESASWTAFAVIYQCAFAYVVALLFYQLGSFFGGAGFTAGTLVAFLLVAVLLFLLFRPGYAPKRRLAAAAARG